MSESRVAYLGVAADLSSRRQAGAHKNLSSSSNPYGFAAVDLDGHTSVASDHAALARDIPSLGIPFFKKPLSNRGIEAASDRVLDNPPMLIAENARTSQSVLHAKQLSTNHANIDSIRMLAEGRAFPYRCGRGQHEAQSPKSVIDPARHFNIVSTQPKNFKRPH